MSSQQSVVCEGEPIAKFCMPEADHADSINMLAGEGEAQEVDDIPL